MTEQIERWLAEQLALRLGLAVESVDRDRPLEEYGLGSLEAVALTGDLEAHFGCRVAPTATWDHRTIAALAAHVASLPGVAALPADESDLDALILQLSAEKKDL